MDKQQFQELVDKYIGGEASQEEIRLLEEFFRRYQQEAGNWQEELMGDEKEVENQIFQNIFSASKNSEILKKNKLFWKSSWFRIAASLVILFAASYFIIHNEKQKQPENQVKEWIVKKNPLGQKMILHLNDGSEVILNSGSVLSYNQDFSGDERKLHLQGEAYFKVARDTMRPFKIITGDLTTTALGTEFNISAYNYENIVVALVSGKVSVGDDNKPVEHKIILKPGEAASLDKRGNILSTFLFDEKEHIAWKNGTLYFKGANEQQVFEKLERWYGVNIIVKNGSSREWDFTGEFHRKSLENVLKSMGFAKRFQYNIKNDSVLINYK